MIINLVNKFKINKAREKKQFIEIFTLKLDQSFFYLNFFNAIFFDKIANFSLSLAFHL
jgi:hypothetical protein